ncbi:MAG TPA: hypothetical protein VM166_01350 [Gemmatimonadaceae bacterium]|nr:hypothetical protein [Gemmatimonadaceae bacterium]
MTASTSSGDGATAYAAELDAAHDRARRAYAARDSAEYLRLFHPALEYTQLDGRTISREQLGRDVAAQLARVDTATSEYHRHEISVGEGGEVTELVDQRASFAVRAFGFLRREWSVRRRGRYQWLRTASGWQIRRVQILTEEVLPVSTQLSFR